MRIFPPELEIGQLEGFDPKKDIFKRAETGRGLTNIVSSIAEPLVIAIDGQWGSGKTTFLRMWAGELRQAGFPVINFDAFATDYVQDAFTALAGEIIGLVQEAKKAGTSSGKKFAKQAMQAGKILLRGGLKVGVKAGTMGALDAADLKAFAADLSSEAGQLFDKHVGELLTKRNDDRATISAFQDALAELPQVLSTQPSQGKDASRPLVFIIDELDRCRPLFALELLERIKHFFAVPGVHFVLGANLAQLRNSVVVAYGPSINAHDYLQKFIHLIVMLDRNAEYRSERISKKYIEYLVTHLQFRGEDRRVVELCMELIELVAEERDLSLRAIERILSNLVIALEVTDDNMFRLPPVIAGLCILKVTHLDLYRKAKNGTLAFDDIEKIFFFSKESQDEEEKHRLQWARDWWRYCLDPSLPQEQVHEMAQDSSLFRYSLQRNQIVPFTANSVIDRFAPRPR